MKKFKSIIFDYDGTIKTHNEDKVSQDVVSLLIEIRKKKILVILATGRPHEHCKYLLDNNLVDCIVSANGSLVKNKYKVIHSEKISDSIVLKVNKFCLNFGLPSTYYSDNLYFNGIINKHLIKGLKESMNIDKKNLKIYNSFIENPIYLMCIFGNNKTESIFRNEFPNLKVLRWHSDIFSVLEKKQDKRQGVLKALDYYKINPVNCIAVGDGYNDIELFEEVGYSISVGYNCSKLNEISDEIIEQVDFEILEKIN